jgi:pilus assembly protein TadC
MNLYALVPGLILGVGVAMIVIALLPRQPHLADTLDRLSETTIAEETEQDRTLQHRVGSWMAHNIPDRSWLKAPTTDLRLIGMSIDKYYYDKVLLALVGLMLPFVLGLFAQAVGFLPFYIPGLIGIPIAFWLWASVDQDIRKKADDARAEFTRAVAVYLEMVAAERKRGATAARALETSADVGRSWVFVRIRQELSRARYAGIAPWDALTNLSEEIDVPDLADVAKIVRLSGEEGASIYETLRSRGKTLRHKLLAEEHEKANSASEKMQIPLSITVFVYVGIIITPLLFNLLAV